MREKIESLASLLEAQQVEALVKSGNDCEANRNSCRTSIKPGAKYTKIDVGTSGKLMVVNATGEIFGIKAYGVIHRGHPYGTIDTIDEWYWGDYYPRRIKVTI